MTKISFALVFALVVVMPLHSVLCDEDDQNTWMNVIEQAKNEASKAGVSEDAIFEAQKVIGDATAQKAAEDVFGGSLSDWVQKAKDVSNDVSGISPTSPDDEEEDNLPEDTKLAPKTSSSTTRAPTSAPTQAPAAAPQAQSPSPSPSPSPF